MTKIATRATRLGDLVQDEYARHLGFCRKEVVVNEASEVEYTIGTVLGKTLTTPAGVAAADAGNTGNGTMGAITADSTAKVGVYKVIITEAASDAGEFEVVDPVGNQVGVGNVAELYTGGGLSFTLADGATDFVAGDFFTIAVTGTEKYHKIEIDEVDGSEEFGGIYIGSDDANNSQTIAATTDTNVVVLYRGPATIGKDNLSYGASVTTDAEIATVLAKIEAAGFKLQEQPNQFA